MNRGATTLSDALRNVPGITLQAGEGGGASNTAGDMFNLRGFNASNSLFVDGVRDDGLISARRLQPGADRGLHGTHRVRRRAGHGRRLREHADQDPAPRLVDAAAFSGFGGAAAVERGLQLGRPGASQQLAQQVGVPPQHALAGRRRAGPRHDQRESVAVAPSLALGLGTFDARDGLGADSETGQACPTTACLARPGTTSSLAPTTVHTSSPVDQANFYGSVGYDYDDATQSTAMARVERDLARGSRCATRHGTTARTVKPSSARSRTSRRTTRPPIW